VRGRVAPHLLGAGIALGIGWRVLQQCVPGQLDAALGLGLLLIVLMVLHGRGLMHIPDSDRALLGVPCVLLLIALIWRDSERLFVLNLLGILGLIACARPFRVGVQAHLSETGVGDLFRRAQHAVKGAALGAWPLLGAVRGPDPARAPTPYWAAGLGILAVSPVLLLFSALLGSADPVFGRLLGRMFNPEPLLQHAAVILVGSWVASGLLWALTRAPSATEAAPRGGRVSSPAIAGALAPIAVLFLAFLIVQSRYLFGGRAVVLSSTDLSVSEYARHGFFELVAVSAAMLPILLLADWAADQCAEKDQARFRFLARALLVLLTGLLTSAMLRMSIYTGAYGLTEDRLFATVFMWWLAFVFGWFAVSVLRGRRERFAIGALGAAFAALLLLNVAGPANLIARVNIWRAEKGWPFDSAHLARLEAGAVPAALAGLPRLGVDVHCDAMRRLHERWSAVAAKPANAWNIERWQVTGPLLTALAHQSEIACHGEGIQP
jgi:hypothetical protein